jgi:hypothetical protein
MAIATSNAVQVRGWCELLAVDELREEGCQSEGRHEHPSLGDQHELPAITNVAKSSGRQRQNNEWKGRGGLNKRDLEWLRAERNY